MREATYQRLLIGRLETLLPGCFILKNDPSYVQGVPDIIILWNDHWAALEVKIKDTAGVQPNQQYYVNELNAMSFAAFINPANEEEVLYELQRAFGIIG